MNYKKITSSLLAFGLFFPLLHEGIYAQEANKFDVKVEIAHPGLTIGKLTEPQNGTKENIAKRYLKGEVHGAKAQPEQINKEKDVDFQPTKKEEKQNQTEIRLSQTYKGYKVYGQDIIVKVDKSGVITTVSGKVAQNLEKQSNLNITNFLSEDKVKSSIRDILQIPIDAIEKEFTGETIIYKKKDGSYTYAEVVTLTYENNAQVISGDAIISVVDGEMLYQEKFIKNKEQQPRNQLRNQTVTPQLSPFEEQGTGKNAMQENVLFNIAKGDNGKFYLADLSRGNGIYIYDANYADIQGGRGGYPGALISSSTVNFADKEAAGVMKNMGDIYDYFKKEHNLKSYNTIGAKVVVSVHAFNSKEVSDNEKENYANAQWRPSWKQMLFGDGLKGTLTSAIDITAHEFGHAVFSETIKSNNTTSSNAETKAINEGLADFWGTQVEMYVKKDKGNWIIGDTLDGRIFRDIPKEIGDWGEKLYTNLQEFYKDTNDKEEHLNSGIISHVLYQLTEGETYNGVSVEKQGNDKVSKMVMYALQNYVTAAEDFESLHSHIVQAARDLYGNTISTEVEKAFQAHGYKSLANSPDRMVLQGLSNVNSVILSMDHDLRTLKVFSDAPSAQIHPDFPGTYFAVTLYDSTDIDSDGSPQEKESVSVKGTDTSERFLSYFDNPSFLYGDILRVEHRKPDHTLVYDEGKEVSISKKEIRYFKLTSEGFVEMLLAGPKINEVTDQDRRVTGTGEAGLKVSVVVGGKKIGSGKVDDKGNFTVNIPKQKGGKELVVTLTDAIGNTSEPAKTQVKMDSANQDKLVKEAKDSIDQLFTDSSRAEYSHDYTTVKKGAIQIHVVQQHMTEAMEKLNAIPDEHKEKAALQKEMERVQKLLKERENEQGGNLVQNGLFDSGLDKWKPWIGFGATAPEVQGDGGKSTNVIKIYPNSSVEQVLTGLEPNTTYELTTYAKSENNEKFSVGTKNTGTANVTVPIYSKEYSQVHLRFKTAPNSTTAIIYLYKSGGTKPGYADVVIAKKVMEK
ncbi:bacillolysin [Bacillus cereus VD196]|uniref:Bacillolysin n=1 Tax=Bacillus cereus VD196 TaxID=1053243 RepID=A0A9W5PY73_BACCE|nr:M4 family metallopeptidase [Bacillus cereus]EOO60146.1 bacillolysin [Bacillus cereus VD196]